MKKYLGFVTGLTLTALVFTGCKYDVRVKTHAFSDSSGTFYRTIDLITDSRLTSGLDTLWINFQYNEGDNTRSVSGRDSRGRPLDPKYCIEKLRAYFLNDSVVQKALR